MLYNTYGTTGIALSTIGFGGMRFRNHNNIDECVEVVHAAYEAGINYFDTAPGYGKSEDRFGDAFKTMKQTRKEKPFYVSTKTMRTTPDEVRRDLETSLKRMDLEYVDFYHFWCVVTPDSYHQRKQNGVLKEFEKLKDEGLIKHICVSTHMAGQQIDEMVHDYPFEGVLLGYSVMNSPYRDAGIKAASDLNMGVVVMNPLGGGIIPTHPERFEFVKTQPDETVTEAALRFLMNDPRITVSLIGFSTVDHVREAVSAVEGYSHISDDEIARIRSELTTAFDKLCTSCGYCEPCPQGVPITKLMDAYNHSVLTSNKVTCAQRLDWHWGIKDGNEHINRCTECGACESACTQKLPILERFKTMKKGFESGKQKKT